jgi:hypothetical protein
MLKTAAFALVVLVAGSFGASSAMAGGGIHTPPRLLGKIERKAPTMKRFVPRKLGKIIIFGDSGRARAVAPRRLPGL